MITAKNLTYTYANRAQPAITGLTFDIQPGEIFGFLGPSGAGKSTTQKILIGLLKGYQGEVCVLGRSLKSWDSSLYERIGVAPETPNHFLKLTALENLQYFRALYSGTSGVDLLTLLDWVGLKEDARQPVGQFSKGMKNRLTVARALMHDPELLFLDEPTSGLDPLNARTIKDLILEQQRRGKTIFLTTHNMTVAEELCQRVALIVDGAIRLIAAPRELKLQYGRSLVRVEYRQDGGVERQDFALEALGSNPAFLSLLQSGAALETIHSQEATLEDVFIQVTGRSL